MKTAATVVVLALLCLTASAADPGWVGEFTDKKFLNGRAVFQLSIEQSGSGMNVRFDAAWNDGHAAAPERMDRGRFPGKH